MQVRTQKVIETVSERLYISISAPAWLLEQLAGFDLQTASYRTPSLPIKVGHELKKLAQDKRLKNRMYDWIYLFIIMTYGSTMTTSAAGASQNGEMWYHDMQVIHFVIRSRTK